MVCVWGGGSCREKGINTKHGEGVCGKGLWLHLCEFFFPLNAGCKIVYSSLIMRCFTVAFFPRLFVHLKLPLFLRLALIQGDVFATMISTSTWGYALNLGELSRFLGFPQDDIRGQRERG